MAVLIGTTAKRNAWIKYLDHCRGGVFVNQLFFGKTIGGVPDVWADAIIALEMALRAGGYTPRSAWAYNFRGIGGADCTCTAYTKCSLHGGQGAIDIDPKDNPYISTSTFRWSDTKFTAEQIKLIEGIRNTKGEQLWFWGGRWSTIKDYMHLEPNVDPGSAEVDWSTVPGSTLQSIKEDEMTLPLQSGDGYKSVPDEDWARHEAGTDRSHKIEDVRRHQDRLNKLPGDDLTLDGEYGPLTIVRSKDVGGGWTGHPDGKEGKWWGGNQDGELDWFIALEASKRASGGEHPDSDHTTLATKASVTAEKKKIDSHIAGKLSGPHH